MPHTIPRFPHARLATLSPDEAEVLLANARALQRQPLGGPGPMLLRGKNFGLLCRSDDGVSALSFRRAASELGARVAHIRPSQWDKNDDHELLQMARVLSRLYDGVECLGVDPAFVRRLAAAATVPVYDGISAGDHPIARLAARLGGAGSVAEKQFHLIQAVLVSTAGE